MHRDILSFARSLLVGLQLEKSKELPGGRSCARFNLREINKTGTRLHGERMAASVGSLDWGTVSMELVVTDIGAHGVSPTGQSSSESAA